MICHSVTGENPDFFGDEWREVIMYLGNAKHYFACDKAHFYLQSPGTGICVDS